MDINSTEQSILEVAERLFTEKGFAMTSTTEIARSVGCNQAMIHYYFRSKDKLFAAIFQKKAQMLIDGLMEMNFENLNFEEKIANFITSHFNMLQKNSKLPFFIINELNTNPKRIESIQQILATLPIYFFKKIETELHNEINEGRVRQISIIDLAMTIVSLNMSAFLLRPIIQKLTNFSDFAYEEFIANRKKENIEIVLRSIWP